MDAGLVTYLQEKGYDTSTETFSVNASPILSEQ
jgi:hypothetical protein